jgi:hypothetical protein
MTWHIVTLAGPEDNYTPALKTDYQKLVVPFNVPGHPDSLQTRVQDVVAEYDLSPSLSAQDLLNAAMAAYTADVRVAREESFDGWTRDFELHLAVQDLGGWGKGATTLEMALSFLTGDRWKINVRQAPESYESPQGKRPRVVRSLKTKTVCLFSGGLDSFIGAVDQVEGTGQVALVGHHSAGGGATSKSQSDALAALRTGYDEDTTPFLQFWVTPPKGEERVSEITTRGRSIMFIGLGIFVASGLGAERLIIPENGLISLNVPLTNARLGSFSTRTTHPYLIALMRELLQTLGISVGIELPYRFKTKGELIGECANLQVAATGLSATMSCSHPGANRFLMRDPNMHCGYCLPCVIRRAAISASGIPDPTTYAFDDLGQPLSDERRSDLRVLKMGLDRYGQKPPSVADILVPGPLPATADELREYLGVFRRGLGEVGNFLNTFK